MNNCKIFDLLQQLIMARGPVGEEDEVASLCQTLMAPFVDELWTDASDNVIGKLKGSDPEAPSIQVLVHMDELSHIVKRVNDDGSIRLEPLGGIFPANMGQGPLEIMGSHGCINGILSFGSMHVTKESPSVHRQIPTSFMGEGQSPSWEDIYLVTRKSPDALEELGIRAGTRVVISRTRRSIERVGDCWAGYFMDNRAAVTTALAALEKMKDRGLRPRGDLYVVGTTAEEIGALGACYAARTLPGDISLAIDVGPVAKEYQIELTDNPIIVYKDSRITYDKKLSDQLFALSQALGQKPKAACFGRYGSDASIAKMYGQTGRNLLLCIPTENTHGYEIIHENGIQKCSELLVKFLTE